jgi:hypothetical protein
MPSRPGAATTALRALTLVAAALVACNGNEPVAPGPVVTPTPPVGPPELPGVTVGSASGPTAIRLVAADPMPGSTITGCGAHSAGCAGRIRMTFRLTPTGTGPVLWCVGFLHAADKTGCLQGRTGEFTLRAGEPQTVGVVFDQVDPSDRCRTPLDITDLAFVVEGTVEVASRQEWALRYQLAP